MYYRSMRVIGAIAAACVVIVLSGSWVMALTTPYALSDWSCGVIAWPASCPE